MTSKRKVAEVQEGIRIAKGRKTLLPQLFPERSAMFPLFVRYFIDQLGQEFTVGMIVLKFLEVTAHLYYPQAFAPNPKLVPRELVLLRYQQKMQFFRRFPEIARSVFPADLANQLIKEFDRQNTLYAALQRKTHQKRPSMKS